MAPCQLVILIKGWSSPIGVDAHSGDTVGDVISRISDCYALPTGDLAGLVSYQLPYRGRPLRRHACLAEEVDLAEDLFFSLIAVHESGGAEIEGL